MVNLVTGCSLPYPVSGRAHHGKDEVQLPCSSMLTYVRRLHVSKLQMTLFLSCTSFFLLSILHHRKKPGSLHNAFDFKIGSFASSFSHALSVCYMCTAAPGSWLEEQLVPGPAPII